MWTQLNCYSFMTHNVGSCGAVVKTESAKDDGVAHSF